MAAGDQFEFQYEFSMQALAAAGVSLEEAQNLLRTLGGILGRRVLDVVPMRLTDVNSVRTLVRLAETFEPIYRHPGFGRFKETIAPGQYESALFTARVAALLTKGSRGIVFEPEVDGTLKRPDLLVHIEEQSFYVECKQITVQSDAYLPEHRRIANLLAPHLDTPVQLTFTYQKPLTDAEWVSLAESVRQRLPYVTGPGRIIRNADVEVDVQPQSVSTLTDLELTISLLAHHEPKKAVYPGHIFARAGLNVVIEGPRVGSRQALKEQMRWAAHQAPPGQPFVLAVDASHLLGSYDDIQQFLYAQMQPGQNTRFSGVLLVDAPHHMGDDRPLDFYRNPFARAPLIERVDNWFRLINRSYSEPAASP